MCIEDKEFNIKWFVRAEVEKSMDENVEKIAALAIEKDLDYVEDLDAMMDCVSSVLPEWSEYTAEEITYLIHYVQTQCSIYRLIQKGLAKAVDGGYKLTELGKKTFAVLAEEENA